MDRIAAVGHGKKFDMTPEQAVAVARDATPADPGLGANDPSGLKVGQKVTVTPDDNARVPVTGTLVGADAQEIVLAIDSAEAGKVHVHFPRAGFEALPASRSGAQDAA